MKVQGFEPCENLPASPRVSVVILNFNGWRDTIECLESNYRGSYRRFETVLVDNGSSDGSLAEIRNWARACGVQVKNEIDLSGRKPEAYPVSPFVPGALTLIQTGKNLGFSAGNNRGIEYALANAAEFIMLVNNDTVLDEDTLARLVEALGSEECMGAVFPLVCGRQGEIQVPVYLRAPANFWEVLLASNLPGILFRRYRFLNYLERRNPFKGFQYDRLLKVPTLVVACTLYRRSFFERLGLFDENLFMYYEEDVMLHRLRGTDISVGFEPRVRIIHKGGVGNKQLPPAYLYLMRALGEMYYLREYMRVGSAKRASLKLLRLMEYLYRMLKLDDYRSRFPEFLSKYFMTSRIRRS